MKLHCILLTILATHVFVSSSNQHLEVTGGTSLALLSTGPSTVEAKKIADLSTIPHEHLRQNRLMEHSKPHLLNRASESSVTTNSRGLAIIETITSTTSTSDIQNGASNSSTTAPSMFPTNTTPSMFPTKIPSLDPTRVPTSSKVTVGVPTARPSRAHPTKKPVSQPTLKPTRQASGT